MTEKAEEVLQQNGLPIVGHWEKVDAEIEVKKLTKLRFGRYCWSDIKD